MDSGYIKIHRKLIKWEWFTDQKTFSVFMYLLLSANHADGAWQGNVVKRGQLITGRKSIAKATGLTERQVRTSLANLEKTGETTSKSTNRFTVVTICNYNKYQIKENKNDQQTANKRPTSDQQTTTNKNEKKKEEVNPSTDFDKFYSAYPVKKGKDAAKKAFAKMNGTKPNIEILLQILEKHKKSPDWTKDGGQFIPHPATWLNKKRWEDEVTTKNKANTDAFGREAYT